MALFTDGSISTIEELLSHESAILDAARTEGIDLTAKLRLAAEELAIELERFLARQRERRSLAGVVVTDALRKWHTFRALSLAYRDAYNHQLNDRYLGKAKEYDSLAGWAQRALFETGVAIASLPVGRAEPPELSTCPGPFPATTHFVAVAWVGEQGGEGAPSEANALAAQDGTALVVTAGSAPPGVNGWNVYAGYSALDLTLQNDTPLALGQSWTEPPWGIRSGRPAGSGQAGDLVLLPSRVLDRG